ncbi:hypothetical protein CCACVL1_25009 [Corchorus capsularis]|uniref:TF-B3 domain-containing protein n=1 Tax=Corchorus capsularis TaxID=210143 RepID=A0A1R3GMF3_COCAP|nr:hypothetical protein CCACVL1_25009 [Corchorus capsularis]
MAARRMIFSKKLSPTDTLKRLAIPMKSLEFFPRLCGGHEVEIMVIDDETQQRWTFSCTLRHKGYPKPVLSKGWRAFVRSKGLQPGDKVTFHHRISQDGIKVFGSIFPRSYYSVTIERASTRLFGTATPNINRIL